MSAAKAVSHFYSNSPPPGMECRQKAPHRQCIEGRIVDEHKSPPFKGEVLVAGPVVLHTFTLAQYTNDVGVH